MSRLSDKFIYELNDKTLTIKKCPNNVLHNRLIARFFEEHDIKHVIIEEGIEVISQGTFSGYEYLQKVKLPSSLTKIENEAFFECLDLGKIVFPSNFSNLEIGEMAFTLSRIVNLKLPKGVVSIGRNAFHQCYYLKRVHLPESLKTLEEGAFSECKALSSINIPVNLEKIEEGTFDYCIKLENVTLPNGLKEIGLGAFQNCESLKHISLPSSLRFIGECAFESCSNLKSIEIPQGVEEISGCFAFCQNLKKVTLPNSIKVIKRGAFASCSSLRTISLPQNLEIISDSAFYKSGLIQISIPSSVNVIGKYAFEQCNHLFNVNFNEGLKKIGEYAFSHCHFLTKVYLPDSIEVLEEYVFKDCINLTNVHLPKSLRVLNNNLFALCNKLKSIEIPEGIETVPLYAFRGCNELEEIHFPSTLKYLSDIKSINTPSKLSRIYLQCKEGKKEIDFSQKSLRFSSTGKLFLFDEETKKHSFYDDGQYIEFDAAALKQNPKIAKLIKVGYNYEADYIKLYYWRNKKIIPSLSVISAMPVEDIDKFFINKNCVEWAKLVKESNVEKSSEAVTSFFKLCYVLGVFSESTSIRDNAVNFIRENIVGKLTGDTIHSKFDGFALENGFNKEYADFFMHYYTNSRDFLKTTDEYGEEIDLTCASYNNFNQVKKVYPNKTLNTNRRADLLLPEHVINVVGAAQYDDVDEDNEEFALVVGKYGYTQEQFEKLQEWYNKGKSINQRDIKLFVSKDEKNNGITYDLLKKDDPRNAILGNITNCCQIVDGAGEECVEYGMTKPNSGFITFNYKDKIIAQAWVWYDEVSKVVCLDNIEVPHKYLKRINENKEIKKSFIDCLLRIESNLKKEMNKHGLEVKKVTIGKGYNDVINILNDRFTVEENSIKLHGYSGYSDAHSQYKIETKNFIKKR